LITSKDIDAGRVSTKKSIKLASQQRTSHDKLRESYNSTFSNDNEDKIVLHTRNSAHRHKEERGGPKSLANQTLAG
jgi:hypothetical protein